LHPFLVEDLCSPPSSSLLYASSAYDLSSADPMSLMHGSVELSGNYPNNISGNYPNNIYGNYPNKMFENYLRNSLLEQYPIYYISVHYSLVHHTLHQSELYFKSDAFESCILNLFADFSLLNLISSCQKATENMATKIVIHLFKWWKSSPLLELYTRVFLTWINCFDLGFQYNICLEIMLKLQRNFLRKHYESLCLQKTRSYAHQSKKNSA
jgi:hypothetical protein